MRVERQGLSVVVALDKGPAENSCRPAVDVLFRSVAEVYGDRTLALVLTGMGQDGLRGAEAISARGGRIVAQDEASSVVWGMPGAVVHARFSRGPSCLSTRSPTTSRAASAARHSWARRE